MAALSDLLSGPWPMDAADRAIMIAREADEIEAELADARKRATEAEMETLRLKDKAEDLEQTNEDLEGAIYRLIGVLEKLRALPLVPADVVTPEIERARAVVRVVT